MNSLASNDLLTWSEAKLSELNCAEVLASGVIDRMHAELGGSHTVVTYPPLDGLTPVEQEDILSLVRPVSDLNLYLHIAFCEFLCPFCHYDTEHSKVGTGESGRMRAYLLALGRELDNWKALLKGSTLRSLYIGGGTPTAVSEERLLALLEAVGSFPQDDNYLACVETSPLTAIAEDGRSKLHSLAKAGVGRFSIGVQSFNPHLLRRSRGHSQQEVIRAVEILSDFDNVNIDLMQDLPGQKAEHIIEDLSYVERYRPAQVTWYIFRIRPEAAWFSRYSRSALEVSDTLESARKSLIIREGMRRMGYAPMPGGRFIREERFRDRFKDVRAGLGATLVGVGVSGYSHGWGHIFRNTYTRWGINGIDSYIKRIEASGFAIEEGLTVDEVERTAGAVVAGIRTGVALPEATAANNSYVAYARELMSRLEAAGLVEGDARGRYSLTELGSLFEEEVCMQFYSPLVKARLRDVTASVRGNGSPSNIRSKSSRLQVIH